MNFADIFGGFFAALFTFLIFSYALGDNALFRMVVHIFIGVAAGYAAAVALHSVLLPAFNSQPLSSLVVPLLWIGLLFTKLSPRTAVLGNPASALLVGVGAAVAVGGAIQGTLLPQLAGSASYFSPERLSAAFGDGRFGDALGLLFNGAVILVGTVTSLAYFHFGAQSRPNQVPQRRRIIEIIARVGQGFIAITLGVLFAGVYSAALVALIERLDSLFNFVGRLARLF
ncbi:MAG: hypothetical protein EPO32_14490 [Anaerolineae bacterium]|nr:MAG: hypothetical protein EPO32_14490 [Anaerolineae bacterium]